MALGADGPTDRAGWSEGWFEDRFTGAGLDPGTWFTSYLPRLVGDRIAGTRP